MKTLIGATALAAAALASSAQANTLLTLTDATGPFSESLSFTADASTDTLTVQGYNVPSFDQFTDNVVSTGGGPNLLGQTWAFVPAAFGSDTEQYDDGTSVNALDFGAVTPPFYDSYSQTFATTAGTTYTYTFDYTGGGNPNGSIVSVSSGAVPEPASWALMMLGVGLAGAGLRGRRKALTA